MDSDVPHVNIMVPCIFAGLLQNSHQENKFSQWLNGEDVVINFWAKGEPDTYSHWCATIETQDGKWHDASCHKPEGFICKYSESTSEMPYIAHVYNFARL